VVTRAMLIVIVIVLGACRVADLDYTGKACPCPTGWQCNLATYTCTQAAPGDGGGSNNDGSNNADGSVIPGVSCLPNPRTNLIYSTVGFSDFPSAWLQSSGQWTKEGGEVKSTNNGNPLAWLSHAVQTSDGSANYRVVATMRYIDSTSGGSVGIGFRIGMGATMYTCTFDPASGEFDLIYTQQGVDGPLQRKILDIPSNPLAAFTMEIMTTGTTQTCCLRGFTDSTLAMPSGFGMSGNPGVVSRDASGAFATFYVYE
jgi:hypothetical protein